MQKNSKNVKFLHKYRKNLTKAIILDKIIIGDENDKKRRIYKSINTF